MKLFPNGIDLDDEKCILWSLEAKYIEEWIKNSIEGKCNQCWKLFYNQWCEILMDSKEVKSIPTNKSEFIKFIMSLPEYKN